MKEGMGLREDSFGGFGFREDEVDAGFQGLLGDGIGGVHGKEDDGALGSDDFQLRSGIEAVEHGHG